MNALAKEMHLYSIKLGRTSGPVHSYKMNRNIAWYGCHLNPYTQPDLLPCHLVS